ncbi:MAG: zf-TFIIB domain-containing protein [Dehalococcoidales bacterium]|nr:zf-TFIIB domain-containing protein [Dehalococcoidales bacterium]
MICPNCKTDMIVVEYRQIELDHCASCHGVWFDSGELELFLSAGKLGNAQDTVAGILIAPVVEAGHATRKCPTCRHGMKEVAIGQPPVHLDVCRHGDGLWFDGGEIFQFVEQLAGQPSVSEGVQQGIIAFVNEAFQAEKKGIETK